MPLASITAATASGSEWVCDDEKARLQPDGQICIKCPVGYETGHLTTAMWPGHKKSDYLCVAESELVNELLLPVPPPSETYAVLEQNKPGYVEVGDASTCAQAASELGADIRWIGARDGFLWGKPHRHPALCGLVRKYVGHRHSAFTGSDVPAGFERIHYETTFVGLSAIDKDLYAMRVFVRSESGEARPTPAPAPTVVSVAPTAIPTPAVKQAPAVDYPGPFKNVPDAEAKGPFGFGDPRGSDGAHTDILGTGGGAHEVGAGAASINTGATGSSVESGDVAKTKLAYTGATTTLVASFGLALLAAGSAISVVARRK